MELSPERLVIPNQIHSARVVDCVAPDHFPDTDGVVTSQTNLVLSIQVADCVPLFIVDPQTHATGLIHAGWRGIINGIVQNSIKKLVQLGCRSDSLKILLGPSICQDNFVIGSEIVDRFDNAYIIPDAHNKFKVNLQGIVTDQLIKSGLSAENITDLGECTFSNKEMYHSYRRDGKAAGRMIAILGWK